MKVKNLHEGKKWRKKKMKKTLIFMAALTVIGMLACSEETTLRWKKQTGDNTNTVDAIVWVTSSGNNTSWSDELVNVGKHTAFKEIDDNSRDGWGEANFNGVPGDINGASPIHLSKGSSETYEINTVAK
jgi:hypothetical protein